ncbi:MAG TPA: gephyrin-like molybdotransferase Glp [Puia sp.]|nr:gephyrin-like molybdotransferase Glp [Puia sp.]
MAEQNHHSPTENLMESNELVSVEQARALIAASISRVHPVVQELIHSTGLAIAEDIFSPLDIPAFDQSSMDGYAIYAEDIKRTMTVQGVMAAGHAQPEILQRNHAMRIFTGAPLPAGSDTIVMQEKVTVHSSGIQITDTQIEKGTHVRKRGSEIKKGELVLKKGTVITAPVAGLIASLGISSLKVYPGLSVSIMATGNELQFPGQHLQAGQVYESNSIFLQAALKPYAETMKSTIYVEDNLEIMEHELSLILNNYELIIITGGVSVGDYDFVRKAADLAGIHCRFHRVKQKPGKPLYFGTKENKVIFGLPGNPASVVSCFYEYVLPAIRFMLHLPQDEIFTAALKDDFKKVKGLTQFLKAYYADGEVEILEAQESYRLRSFAKANCLVELDEHRINYDRGEMVTFRLLPK